MARFFLFSSENVPLDIALEVVDELNAQSTKIENLKNELRDAINDNQFDHNLALYASATLRAAKNYWDAHPEEYQAKLLAEKQQQENELAREYARGERCT